jgi:hypothetical protein
MFDLRAKNEQQNRKGTAFAGGAAVVEFLGQGAASLSY